MFEPRAKNQNLNRQWTLALRVVHNTGRLIVPSAPVIAGCRLHLWGARGA
ncbi:MAG TPA: hypothetical protein VKO18_17665 [Terriglobia bacterium]|nr:hypothetical protein [Terriglobia bacterium]